jgi:hypothetical protein
VAGSRSEESTGGDRQDEDPNTTPAKTRLKIRLVRSKDEMTEAALFYESSSDGLGNGFLDDVQRAIDRLCDYPA